jgi:acetolactate synthase I/II/III large subunit
MNVAEYIANELNRRGIERVFEVTGGMITFLLDALYRDGRVQIVSLRHEQAAAMAADVYGRLTGKPGVAMATSGPGAINLLTGIAGAYFDSSPAVFITGQVNREEQRGPRAIRQQGFQETDIVSMAHAVTKGAWTVEDAASLPAMLDEAFRLAVEGRPGPVLLDIPMDVQRQEVGGSSCMSAHCAVKHEGARLSQSLVRDVLSALADARRPLILVGGGLRAAGAVERFRFWSSRIGVPVAYSLMGVDVLPSDSPNRVGLVGTNGNRWANKAMVEADTILVLGSRLDVRQTGSSIAGFTNQRIIHIDCVEAQINNRLTNCTPILADIFDFLLAADELTATITWPNRREWLGCINHWQQQRKDCEELGADIPMNPNLFVRELTGAFQSARVIVTDVGQNQLWAAQSVCIGEKQRFLSPGGLGAMGFGLPAAISAAMVSGETILFAGDGGFQMNIQELQSVVHHALPLRMVVLNNQSLGMVRQFQDSYLDGRYQSTVWGYSAPNFMKIALAYGIPAKTLVSMDECREVFEWMKRKKGPCLLQVMLDPTTDLYPKVKFGNTLSEMDPPVDFKGYP